MASEPESKRLSDTYRLKDSARYIQNYIIHLYMTMVYQASPFALDAEPMYKKVKPWLAQLSLDPVQGDG